MIVIISIIIALALIIKHIVKYKSNTQEIDKEPLMSAYLEKKKREEESVNK